MAAIPSTLGRHQLASIVATAADFGAMALLVERAHVAAGPATLLSASLGAVVNFSLNRRLTFAGARLAPPWPQALRYATVSLGSAVLNAMGEHVGTRVLAAPYLAVRVVVAVAVSLAWNYPLHRAFVFRRAEEAP